MTVVLRNVDLPADVAKLLMSALQADSDHLSVVTSQLSPQLQGPVTLALLVTPKAGGQTLQKTTAIKNVKSIIASHFGARRAPKIDQLLLIECSLTTGEVSHPGMLASFLQKITPNFPIETKVSLLVLEFSTQRKLRSRQQLVNYTLNDRSDPNYWEQTLGRAVITAQDAGMGLTEVA